MKARYYKRVSRQIEMSSLHKVVPFLLRARGRPCVPIQVLSTKREQRFPLRIRISDGVLEEGGARRRDGGGAGGEVGEGSLSLLYRVRPRRLAWGTNGMMIMIK